MAQMRHYHLLKTTLLLASLAATGTASPAQTNTLPGQSLRPGDHLRITVLSDDKNLSGEFEVAPDSSLKHPLYNQLKVVGVPISQLRATFASFLRKFQREPQFEVEPLFKVTVSGEVKAPNFFLLPPETTLMEAITRAGGPTERANLDQVTLMRDGQKLSLNLGEHGSPREMLTIQSGDQVRLVPRRNVVTGISKMTPLVGLAASVLSVIYILGR
jgi:polysaccharide biosynthesis/export protein